VLVNGRILIDCGSTLPDAIEFFNVDPQKISDLLLTHSHSDHLCPDTLAYLVAKRADSSPLRLWGHRGALDRISAQKGVELNPVEVGEGFKVGAIHVEALPANHLMEDSTETALHYLFVGEIARWLYAADGAWLLEATWARLHQTTLDAIILDATIGEVEGDYRIFSHNSIPMIRLMISSFRQQSVIKPGGQVFLTHFARQLHPPHEDLERKLGKEGLVPAYDGMYIRIFDSEEEVE
jgi:phosphoribosyl 1,2-cyclic phosphate phosphodiesterase